MLLICHFALHLLAKSKLWQSNQSDENIVWTSFKGLLGPMVYYGICQYGVANLRDIK
jgi:hypothetical protein